MASASHLQIPPSQSHVKVSIINTTARISQIPTSIFFGPAIKGFELFSVPAFAFLITHTDATTGAEEKIIFDLGPPKNWQDDFAPHEASHIAAMGATIEIDKYVSEILTENNMPLDSIDAVIWSHPHWDHVGRVSVFPQSTDLIVGPGIKAAYYPGYPANPNSPILSRDFADRKVTELTFDNSTLEISNMKALDFFGDGSFYLLSAPGHSIGHLNALARTTPTTPTSPSTFILMGADSFHHASQLRPSPSLPLPSTISLPDFPSPLPTTLFSPCHPSHPTRKSTIPPHYHPTISEHHASPTSTPYTSISISSPETGSRSVAINVPQAIDTIHNLQPFDGDENVFVVAAHDASLLGVVEEFPASANEWKVKGWKDEGKWRFMRDLWGAMEGDKGET